MAGQVAGLAVQAGHAGRQVDVQAAEAQHLVALLLGLQAAQQGLDAGLQLARLEGLGQVVVGTEFEAEDAVHRFAAGRQHQHRQALVLAFAAQLAAEVQAIAIGQHQVEHEEVKDIVPQGLAACGQRAGYGHLKAGSCEVVLEHGREAGVVVNQQESGGHGGGDGAGAGALLRPAQFRQGFKHTRPLLRVNMQSYGSAYWTLLSLA